MIGDFRLGLQEEIGVVVAAPVRTDFPTELEMIVLRVAANQALIALQEAHKLREAEERLRRSEAQLAEAQRLSHTGGWGWEVESGRLIFSQETYRILGFDPDQPPPAFEMVIQRLHPDDQPFVERILEGAIRQTSDYEFEARIVLPDRSTKHVRCVGRPLPNKSGKLEFIGTLLDITDRKSAEEALQVAQAQVAHMARVTTMGELAAAIAHEVNQPLAAVVTNANACVRWLAGDTPDLVEARAAAARIATEGKRASDVLVRIRALLQKSPTRMEAVDLNQVVQQVWDLVRPYAVRQGISLQTQLAANLPAITGDIIQLQQVLLNLTMNAIEAAGAQADGQREVSLSTGFLPPDGVLVAVHDSGAGLDPARLDDLFAPFHTTKPGGMGMGLPISRSIVEAHAGRLWAEPNPGPGATFQFRIPARTMVRR
jgi:signal transduction histidine kinase